MAEDVMRWRRRRGRLSSSAVAKTRRLLYDDVPAARCLPSMRVRAAPDERQHMRAEKNDSAMRDPIRRFSGFHADRCFFFLRS